jgi:hypothetical protein
MRRLRAGQLAAEEDRVSAPNRGRVPVSLADFAATIGRGRARAGRAYRRYRQEVGRWRPAGGGAQRSRP